MFQLYLLLLFQILYITFAVTEVKIQCGNKINHWTGEGIPNEAESCIKQGNWCFNTTGTTVYTTGGTWHGCAPNYIKVYCDKYRPYSLTEAYNFCIRLDESDLKGRLCCCNNKDFCNTIQ